MSNVCLKQKDENIFDPKQTANMFKDFFSSLADKLVSKLPKPSNKYGETFVSSYYENLDIDSSFDLNTIEEQSVKKILKGLKPSKAPGIDGITGRFLKDGANILALPIAQLCNLSISLSSFPNLCKTAKVKPLF